MVAAIASEIEAIISNLTLEEKVSLLAGKDFWRTRDIQEKGVASIKTTDGPSGARGGQFAGGCKAAFFPCGVSMAATFDTSAVHNSGKAIAQEAISKQAHMLLAPTTCIHRSPLGGRNFESYSEDPFLSGKLTSHFVTGVQSENVAATVKHYVGNEQETSRFTVNEIIDERTLREIYLYPFELAVKESNPWCLMTAYNMVNGEHADCNNMTLAQVLRKEWKYDGLVVSDWGGTNSVSDSVLATLDLEMPGPTRKRGDKLVKEAKSRPEVQDAIDNSVRRLLNLISRVGRWKNFTPEAPEQPSPREDHRRIIRNAASDGIVLLKNEKNLLPIKGDPATILVIGPNGDQEVAGGGGSSNLNPYYMTNPLKSITTRFSHSKVTYERGCTSFKWTELLSGETGCRAADDQPGFDVTYYKDESLAEVVERKLWSSSMLFPIDSLPMSLRGTSCAVRLSFTFTPTQDGTYIFGLASIGRADFKIDNKEVLFIKDGSERSELMFGMASGQSTYAVKLSAGRAYKLEATTESGPAPSAQDEALASADEVFSCVPGLRLGCSLERDQHAMIAAAVEAAKSSDYVVAVVGLNNEWEAEGHDMHDTQMQLPGLQNKLISEVAKVNRNITICNQSGVAIAMPWLDEVGAVMQCWYQGMEMGNAIADILSGDVNPSGKLPVTFPKGIEDTPCHSSFGGKNEVTYEEGIYVGYRYYDTKQVEPLFPFGFGLSYTHFKYSGISLSKQILAADDTIQVSFKIKNEGELNGKEAFQVYVSPVSPTFADRAIKELKGFGKLCIRSGQTETGQIELNQRSVSRYDPNAGCWMADKGTYMVLVGSSSRDLYLTGSFVVEESFRSG